MLGSNSQVLLKGMWHFMMLEKTQLALPTTFKTKFMTALERQMIISQYIKHLTLNPITELSRHNIQVL